MPRYRFETREHESAWDAIQRIAHEAGLEVHAPWRSRRRLRRRMSEYSQSRAKVTREEFIRVLADSEPVRIGARSDD